MEVMFGIGPVVHGDDDIALHVMRPRRYRRRQFACLEAIGPRRQAGQVPTVWHGKVRDGGDHADAGRSGLQPPRPRLLRVGERAQGRGNLACRLVAELVTVAATVQLDDVEPLLLALKGHRHAVAFEACTGEQALVWNVKHGKPIDGWIVLRCRRSIGRNHGLQVDERARLGFHLRRIDEPVAAHPDIVRGFWQVGHHVAPARIGDYHLGEPGAQVCRFRDYPDTGFRPPRAGDYPADVVIVDLDRAWWCWLGTQPGR